ncbi:MAG: hypothetical protein ACLRFE_03690 [Clostridia bacterium]
MGIINLNFDEKELEAINAPLEDKTQAVYREYVIGTSFNINCRLPQGNYGIVFRSKQDAQNACGDFHMKGLSALRNQNRVILQLNENKKVSFVVSGGGCKELITNLRKQVILHERKLQQEDNLGL